MEIFITFKNLFLGRNFMKKFFIFCLSFITIFSFSLSSVSAVSITNIPTSKNTEWNPEYIDENGNYDNPITGEYFHWEETVTRGGETAKSFSFEIKSWLSSGSFKLKAANARIDMDYADFVWTSGKPATCCNSHRYTVNLRREGLSNNIATFKAPHGSWVWDLGDGFSTSANYNVEITNIDELPDYSIRLRGAGRIYSYWF